MTREAKRRPGHPGWLFALLLASGVGLGALWSPRRPGVGGSPVQSAPGSVAKRQALPIAPGPGATPSFGFESRSQALAILSDVPQPVDDLRLFGEGVLDELRRWLEPTGNHARAPHYRVYLCREIETMLALEAANGLPRSDPSPDRSFEYRGGFYAEANLILLECGPDEDMRWDVAHELSHAVYHERIGVPCDVLDEGLAEYAATRALGQPRPYLSRTCARSVGMRGIPTLENFFGLDYWQFRDSRAQFRSYALAWFLVRMLIEDESPELAGRFPGLLENVRTAWTPWEAFQSTYDVAAVEALWNESLELRTRWLPTLGVWRGESGAMETDLAGSRSALLLYRDRPWHGVPYELEFRLAQNPGGAFGLGFALGYVNSNDYVIVSLRNHEGDAVIAQRGEDGWDSKETLPMDLPEDLSGLTLRCDAQGILTIAAGEAVLLRHDLGVKAFRGHAGIWVEQRHADDSEHWLVRLEARFTR